MGPEAGLKPSRGLTKLSTSWRWPNLPHNRCCGWKIEIRDELDSPTELRDDLDGGKLAEAALALLSLTLHDGRVWKALDWNLMNLLFEKGWIFNPASKAKSVLLTEEGERCARAFLLKHFGLKARDIAT